MHIPLTGESDLLMNEHDFQSNVLPEKHGGEIDWRTYASLYWHITLRQVSSSGKMNLRTYFFFGFRPEQRVTVLRF